MTCYSAEKWTEMFAFLDDLRATGRTNMFGAGHYLREEFGLDRDTSYAVLKRWMDADLTKSIADRVADLDPALVAQP